MNSSTRSSDTIAPTVFAIFGITGDLSRRKLLSALWHLFRSGKLPEQFHIIGFSRRDFSTEDIRTFVRSALSSVESSDDSVMKDFLTHFSYQQGHFDELPKYRALAARITEIEHNFGTPVNRIFYLAVAPEHYKIVFETLHNSGVTDTSSNEQKTYTRILVEKPFGRDAQTAKVLDERLASFFREEQIYRIDHYLAKETVQNILNFRFSNFIFESIWNKNGIEKVHIELLETLGMEGRGAFYSDTGALRDVGQNHLLQLLAVVAMKNPIQFDAEHIRKARADVLSHLRPMTDVRQESVRGQYKGFADELGIENTENIETYFKLRTYLDDPVWEGVPFILESGKRMKEDIIRITIYFKAASHTLCPIEGGASCQNKLCFDIKPEGITGYFWAKKPGLSNEIEQRTFHFNYGGAQSGHVSEAYERVLYDATRGDQTLFTSTEEVHAAWRYITPILEAWSDMSPEPYEQGTLGPDARTRI